MLPATRQGLNRRNKSEKSGLMAHHHPVKLDAETVGNFNDLGEAPERTALIVGVIAIVAAAFLSMPVTESLSGNWQHFLFAYLVNFVYVTSFALGALFFVGVQYLVRAGWSVVVRRIAEVISLAALPCAILFLPLLAVVWSGYGELWPWNDAVRVAEEPLMARRAGWMNATLFTVRGVVYFAIWIGLSRLLFLKSKRQDETGDPKITNQLEGWGAATVFLFAMTATFASFDWIVSLHPTWFSTMYGVYLFAGSLVGFFSLLNLVVLLMLKAGKLSPAVTAEHRHNISKGMFFATCFWGYIAFSQYLLYWYANIPEETMWYLDRQQAGWGFLSYVLIFGHFAVPFLGMLSRTVKRNANYMLFWSCYMLAMHWLDVYWQIMPNMTADVVPFGLTEILTLAGMVAIVFAGVMWQAGGTALIPVRDPRLDESMAFHDI